MPWIASYARDVDVDASRPNGDAVITRADEEIAYLNRCGATYVQTISVRTARGGRDVKIIHCDTAAFMNGHLESFAILERETVNR